MLGDAERTHELECEAADGVRKRHIHVDTFIDMFKVK